MVTFTKQGRRRQGAGVLQPLYGPITIRKQVPVSPKPSPVKSDVPITVGKRESINPVDHCDHCHTLAFRTLKVIDSRGETMACCCDCHIRTNNPYNTVVR